jgi:hypothetical protein
MRFVTQKYRADFAGLDYRVVDIDELEIIDDAMSAEDAADFAEAMNALDRYFAAERTE